MFEYTAGGNFVAGAGVPVKFRLRDGGPLIDLPLEGVDSLDIHLVQTGFGLRFRAFLEGGTTWYSLVASTHMGLAWVRDYDGLFVDLSDLAIPVKLSSGAYWADILVGGSGNDTISGGGNGDTLTGGSGEDTFSFYGSNTTRGTITDFTAVDRIEVKDLDLRELNGSQITNTVNFVEGESLTLQGNFTGKNWRVTYDVTTTTSTLMMNSGPVAADDYFESDASGQVSGNFILGVADGAGRDTDADGDSLIISVIDPNLTYFVSWSFDGNGGFTAQAKADVFKALGAGDTLSETFTYAITDSLGLSDFAAVTLTLRGVNDVAVIAGATSGETTEDGVSTASGTLTVSDVDTGESSFQAQVAVRGTYGLFSFDDLTGEWTYALDASSAALKSLNAGETAHETFTVKAHDGTSQTITLAVNGADEPSEPLPWTPTPVITPNANGGVDITILDPSQLTPSLGTSGVDHVFYGGSGAVTLPGTIENVTLTSGNAGALGNALDNVLTGSTGDNRLQGGSGKDKIVGRDGDDRLFGDSGQDRLSGGAGKDRLNGGAHSDRLDGGAGNDTLAGESGNDTVIGGAGNDALTGGSGHDVIYGGLGADVIDDNYGRDAIVFNTRLGKGEVDTLKNFNVGPDTIWLENAIFKGVGRHGWLKADAFHIGSRAADKEDRVIYDAKKGMLYYDADGVGGKAQIAFAKLSKHLTMTEKDFLII